MTSPEGRCEVRQAHYLMFATLEFMRQSPFANSWAFIDPCVPGLPICAHPNSLWRCSLTQNYFLHGVWTASHSVAQSGREFGVGWALLEQWEAGHCSEVAMEAGEVSMAPVNEGWLLERAPAQPWAWGGFYDLSQGTAFLLSSCS